jgi:hypothetical protein
MTFFIYLFVAYLMMLLQLVTQTIKPVALQL